jgi:osmotically-inducible protein OsmY
MAALAAIPILSLSALAEDTKPKEPDNTKTNERDKSGDTRTPLDQSNTPEDLKLVQNIRHAVVKEKSLSMTAKNVKIITAGGQVTLRGPVNNADEKKKIEDLASAAAGKGKVVSQLEVKSASKE